MNSKESLIKADSSQRTYSGNDKTCSATGKELTTLHGYFDYVGRGKTQYLIWIVSFIVGYADYSELLLISLLIPHLRCHWDLSQNFDVALSFCLFGSYALFSYFIAQQADRLGRKKVLIGCSIVLILASCTAALFDNKWVFMVTRLFTGASVGANVSVLVPYTVEMAQNRDRVTGPLMFNFGVLIAILSINFQGLLFLDLIGYQWFIAILTAPLFAILALLFYMPDSPRYLLVANKVEQLQSTLFRIAKINGVSLENTKLEIKNWSPESSSQLGSLKLLLSSKLRRNFISLMLYYTGNICIEFGLIVLLPLLFSVEINERRTPAYTCKALTKDDFYKLMLSSIAGILGFAVFIVVMQKIGRLFALRLSGIVTCIMTVTLYFRGNETYILMLVLIVKFIETGGNSTFWVAAQELVPTTVRSTAVGCINSVGKVGGMIGTCSVYLLFYKSYVGLVSLFLIFQIAGFVGTLVLNKESKGSEICDTTNEMK